MNSRKKREAGVWIDRLRAVTVKLYTDPVDIKVIHSGLKGRTRAMGGSRSRVPYGPQIPSREKNRDEKFGHFMRKYLQTVIAHFDDAERLLIAGPGEAKIELKKELLKQGCRLTIEKIETADTMTSPQFVAKVKNFYGQKVKGSGAGAR